MYLLYRAKYIVGLNEIALMAIIKKDKAYIQNLKSRTFLDINKDAPWLLIIIIAVIKKFTGRKLKLYKRKLSIPYIKYIINLPLPKS